MISQGIHRDLAAIKAAEDNGFELYHNGCFGWTLRGGQYKLPELEHFARRWRLDMWAGKCLGMTYWSIQVRFKNF